MIDPALRAEADHLLGLLKKKNGLRDARVIKSNMVRTVLEVRDDGAHAIVKRYRSAGLINALKYLVRPTRARTEWDVMRRFNELGIPTAQAIVSGEKRRFGILADSFFASTVIKDSSPSGPYMLSLLKTDRWTPAIRDRLFEKLARLTVRLHDAGVFHADYHLGNVLVSGVESGDPDLFIIDLHSVFFPGKLARRQMLLNLVRVAESVRHLGPIEVDLFLEKYLAHRPDFSPSKETLKKEVLRRVAALDRRSLRSRTRRCLVRSSRFRPARAGGYRMNIRRTVEPEQVLEAIRIHHSVAADGDSRLVPPSDKNKVTLVDLPAVDGAIPVCVKEYRPRPLLRRLLLLPSDAKRSWVGGLGLEVRHVDTPETIAWVRRGARELLITRALKGAMKLHAYAANTKDTLPPGESVRAIDGLAVALARFVRRIHDCNIRHRDFCEQNILVREVEGKPVFSLIDLDTVTFATRLEPERIVKNLSQLGHLPGDVDVLLKARFLKHYLGGPWGNAHSALFRQVDRGVLRRMEAKRERYRRMGAHDPHPIPSALKREWS